MLNLAQPMKALEIVTKMTFCTVVKNDFGPSQIGLKMSLNSGIDRETLSLTILEILYPGKYVFIGALLGPKALSEI